MRFALAMVGGLALLAPEAARAQYIDGLPAASTVAPSDDVVVCQGGVTGKPGSCTPRRATVTQFETSLPGNVAGALNVGGTGTFAGLVNLTGQTTANYNTQDGAQFLSNFNPTFSGGGTPVVSNGRFNTTITGAPTTNFWNLLAQMNFNGTGADGTTDLGSSFVAAYAQTNRNTAPAGGTANNPRMWAAVLEYHDHTNTKSSQTQASLILEGDMAVNNLDDANNREGILSLALTGVPRDSGGITGEADEAFGANTDAWTQWKRLFATNGNFRDAAIDLRGAADNGSAGLARPTVTAQVTASTSVPVSNVMPFSGLDIAYFGGADIFHATQVRNVSAIAISGQGPAGTLTLTAPITVAAGTQVLNNSRTIWMKDGQTFCIGTLGSNCILGNGSALVTEGDFQFGSGATVPNGKNLTFPGGGADPQPIFTYQASVISQAGILTNRDFEIAGGLFVVGSVVSGATSINGTLGVTGNALLQGGVQMISLPTNCSGHPSGTVVNLSNVLNICP